MCSILLDIREIHIKTTIRHNYTTIRMTNIKKADNTKSWQESGATETIQLLVGMQNGTTLERVWYFFVKYHVTH